MKILRENNEELEFTTIFEDSNNASIFKHFKGNLYKVVTIAKDCEDLKEMVVYQGQYDDKPCWIREKDDFFGLLDKEKYPNIEQKYRFEKIK
ncbi:MAG: DUF1653 domain-containing protein [Bacilli bacterium]|nr:DUF1653 domain-containing protein [Bacilli bacterium]